MDEAEREEKHELAEEPPEAWQPARRALRVIARPIEQFLHIQASSGVLLLAMAAIAMAWANSPWRASYQALWHTELSIGLGEHSFRGDLHFWINDVLMVIFFFVVGLEIRREMYEGELSNARRAALPVAAALGGMVAPALIYLAFNRDPEVRMGWGVPMATDIAFAVGVFALLGTRVPSALRVLLLSLAIIDDIGSILVIAFFYSSGVSLPALALAFGAVLCVFVFQRFGVRKASLYVLPGIALWFGVYRAGVHPTIAGVILGLLTPARAWYGLEGFLAAARHAMAEAKRTAKQDSRALVEPLHRLRGVQREAVPPAVRLEAMLHPYVAFIIMPLFALSNAGVALGTFDLGEQGLGVLLGVAFGLLLGKPLGIVAVSMLACRLGIAALPRNVGARELWVMGGVAGIGFTMAIFVAQLAFDDPGLLATAKLSVLLGSLAAGLVGALAGLSLLPKRATGTDVSVGEAEGSTEY